MFKVSIINPLHIGDAVISTAVVRRYSQLNPNEALYFGVCSGAVDILYGFPFVNVVYACDDLSMKDSNLLYGPFQRNLEISKYIAGKKIKYRSILELFGWSIGVDRVEPVMYVNRCRWDGEVKSPSVLVHLEGHQERNSYPLDLRCRLVSALMSRLGVSVYYVGLANQRLALIDGYGLLDGYYGSQLFDLSGQTMLSEVADLCHRVDMVLCVDSAISHISAACHVPQLVIGNGHWFAQYRPLNDKAQCVLETDVDVLVDNTKQMLSEVLG